jgi:hypothetical protein
MSNVAPGPESDARRSFTMEQLPPNLAAGLKALEIESTTTVYAVCPSCSFLHAPEEDKVTGVITYPDVCQNTILNTRGSSICGETLLELRLQQMKPIKTFVLPSFEEYLARILSDPEIERMCDQACDDAFLALDETPEVTSKIFHAEFMKTFQGPDRPSPHKKILFIHRMGRLRLAFEVQLDFFNPNGTQKRGNHDSIGIISIACMNLDGDIRYKPEYIYACFIPGPHEPNVDEIDYYLGPIIDVFVAGWEHGLHIAPTGSSVGGRDVDLAVILSINDLPAARKISGSAGVSSHFFCTVCDCYHTQNVWNTNFQDWKCRDVRCLHENTMRWKNATTRSEREQIFKETGVR